MRGYKVVAKVGKDSIKFDLPIGVPQETLNEVRMSARKLGAEAFGFKDSTLAREQLSVAIAEYYED